MKFESKEQKEELINQFKQIGLELEEEKRNDPKTDKNYNCKILVDYRCEYEEVERDANGEIVSCKGDIYFFVIRQPKLIDAIKILEAGKSGSVYSPSLLAWDCMIDQKGSSPEIFTDRIKLGYLTKMISHIDALLEDSKKN